jgi:chromosome segregation ATPase
MSTKLEEVLGRISTVVAKLETASSQPKGDKQETATPFDIIPTLNEMNDIKGSVKEIAKERDQANDSLSKLQERYDASKEVIEEHITKVTDLDTKLERISDVAEEALRMSRGLVWFYEQILPKYPAAIASKDLLLRCESLEEMEGIALQLKETKQNDDETPPEGASNSANAPEEGAKRTSDSKKEGQKSHFNFSDARDRRYGINEEDSSVTRTTKTIAGMVPNTRRPRD